MSIKATINCKKTFSGNCFTVINTLIGKGDLYQVFTPSRYIYVNQLLTSNKQTYFVSILRQRQFAFCAFPCSRCISGMALRHQIRFRKHTKVAASPLLDFHVTHESLPSSRLDFRVIHNGLPSPLSDFRVTHNGLPSSLSDFRVTHNGLPSPLSDFHVIHTNIFIIKN
jgi:hypothetical protein